MLRRGLAYFVLVFSLLFAQQGGFAHELSHVPTSSQGEKQLPHSKLCDQCGAYSQVGAGAVAQTISFQPQTFSGTVQALPDVVPHAAQFTTPLSRAPPFLA